MRTANITWQPIYCIRAGHIVSTIGVVHSLASVWAVALRNRLRKILSRGFDSASGLNYRDVHCLSEVSLFIILSRVSLSVLSVCLSVSSKYYDREDVATTTTSLSVCSTRGRSGTAYSREMIDNDAILTRRCNTALTCSVVGLHRPLHAEW